MTDQNPYGHERDIGRLETGVSVLFETMKRIEEKLDANLTQHDKRLRDVEGEIKALRRIGTIFATIWSSVVALVIWMFRVTQ